MKRASALALNASVWLLHRRKRLDSIDVNWAEFATWTSAQQKKLILTVTTSFFVAFGLNLTIENRSTDLICRYVSLYLMDQFNQIFKHVNTISQVTVMVISTTFASNKIQVF